MAARSRRIAIMSPHYIHMGETHVIPTLAVELAKLGYQVDLLRAWKEWELDVESRGGGAIRIVSLGTRRFAPIIPDITRISSWAAYRVWAGTVSAAMLPGLVCYLRRERPDALIARMLTTSAAFGKFVSRTDTKLILSVAGEPSPTRLRNRLWKFLYPKAAALVAPVKGVAESASGIASVDSSRYTIIPNPVLDDRLMAKSHEPLEHPWIDDADHPLILGVGRLSRQKGFDTLIRAVAKLRETIPARLMILGEGERRGRLENLIAELGLSDVVSLPGFSNNPYQFMRKADLFVMSSLWEGPGHVLIEAQGVGTIVVTTDCPSGPRESLLDGRLGKIVPVGDHEAMAEAIAESLANRERSDQIAIDGLAHSERYRPASVANSWSDLIESL